MEERRRQMMADAKANNKERSGNVRRYKEEEKREVMEVRALDIAALDMLVVEIVLQVCKGKMQMNFESLSRSLIICIIIFPGTRVSRQGRTFWGFHAAGFCATTRE